ncbi:hypothetical protein ABFB50_06580 [Dehalococcoides sp. THU3]|uniref:hypothetical protein n=1 Tax=Dehalococcoides TaxID=61434 RepID=UPI00321819B0
MELISNYKKHFIIYETIAGLIFGSLITIWSINQPDGMDLYSLIKPSLQTIYSTIATIASSVLGFIITAITIILGLTQLPSLKIIRESKYYPMLYSVLFCTIKALGMTTLFSIIGLIINNNQALNQDIFYAIVIGSSISTIQIARSFWILEKIVYIGIRQKIN